MSLLGRIFGRREPQAPQTIDNRRMNEDWARGDLAVAIVERCTWLPGTTLDPEKGDLLRVSVVQEGMGWPGTPFENMRAIFLYFESKGEIGYQCTGFRKVVPDHTAAETELSERIKRANRKVAPA